MSIKADVTYEIKDTPHGEGVRRQIGEARDLDVIAIAYDMADAQGDDDGQSFADDPVAWWNPGRVDWYLKKQAAADAEIRLIEKQAQEMIDRLEKEKARREKWFGASFEEWHRRQREASGINTFRYLHGTVKTTRESGRIVLHDRDVAMEWARQNMPGAITRKETLSLDTRAIIAASETTGEVPDGFEFIEPRIRVTIAKEKESSK